ncbi:MAG TPA: sigma-70 family RNA polymerase sigma factor, partial [Polyangia bacterium]|nr:sigma-70 family RNA polymerase sigma factor [Polyangia bacterium]
RRLASRLASRLGRSDAEDLASEAIARGLARPAPDGRQAPWIETIFRNLVSDTHRRGRRVDPIDDEPIDGGATPEEALLGCERRRAVAAVLPAIPDDLRDALVARFYEDQDYQQVAAARGISVATARTRVFRGLAQLRRSLAALRAWWPVAWTSGSALPAVAVAVLAIGPGMVPARATTGAIISDGDSRVPAMRIASARPTLRMAAARRTRATVTNRPAVPARATAPAEADDAPKPEAVKRMDFDDDEVAGELEKPGFIFVTGSPREEKLGSLIEIPRSLWPSMEKMVEDN